MPGPQTIARGNIQLEMILAVTLSPAAVAANTSVEQTFSVAGLNVGDFIDVNKPTVQAGLGIINSRVAAANTLAIGFSNNTVASITPTANEIYNILVSRPENLTPAGNSILSQIV